MRSSWIPATSRHSVRASSSVWCTEMKIRAGSMPRYCSLVTHSQAYSMAPFLK